ncbi:MAG: DNA-3-methyladenine glycosylase [Puniceicoccaceae bacterium]|nr:MAG: DNA-3-methyladenine glycosylase [Puniceicoccaceae bacterium]
MAGRSLRSEPIPAAEFAARDTPALARALLGSWLVAGPPLRARPERFRLTEVEAYDGPEDLACHASRGRTARTAVMFGPPGRWYVYLIYGMHEMLNLVTGPEDYPAAVLIRGVEGISGPGRLTRALGIDRRLNARPALPENGLYLEKGYISDSERIVAGPRVGVDYAGPHWSRVPFRFRLLAAGSGGAGKPGAQS